MEVPGSPPDPAGVAGPTQVDSPAVKHEKPEPPTLQGSLPQCGQMESIQTNKRRRRETSASSGGSSAHQSKRGQASAGSPPSIVSPSQASADAAGRLVGCEFDLIDMRWVDCVDNTAILDGFSVAQLPICSVTAKRRRGREEYESERRAQEILRTSGWTVCRSTQFKDLECLISTLVRRLENAGGLTSDTLAWCVGGSIDATLAARDANGCSRRLRFALCGRDDWAGDRQSTKAGNTCRWHAGGLSVTNVCINGAFHQHLTLRKCTWMKCCYGRKHYGDPPLIPWCSTCEFQKKVARRAERESHIAARPAPTASTAQQSHKVAPLTHAPIVLAPARAMDPPSPLGSPSSAPADPKVSPEPCNDCFKSLAKAANKSGVTTKSKAKAAQCSLCGSCQKLSVRVAAFVGGLSTALVLASVGTPTQSSSTTTVGNMPHAQRSELTPSTGMGNGSGSSSGADIGMEALKVRHVVLGLLSKIDLVKQGRKVDPVLLDALKYRYNVSSYEALWSDSASARAALTRIVLDDICIASQIHAGLVTAASSMPICPASNLLRSLPISLFLTCWQSSALTPAF